MPRPRLDDHSPAELATRRLKVGAHRVRRLARWLIDPTFSTCTYASPDDYPIPIGRISVPLDRVDGDADPRLEAGKRHNLRLAAPFFDGLVVGPTQPLSFWRTLGRLTAARGFVYGLELRGGCLVPALGGGICLLSNALFAVAARLGWRILERHGHSMEAVPPPPDVLWGLDATVFWPYVDLRIAPRHTPMRLSATVDDRHLEVAVHGIALPRVHYRLHLRSDRIEGDHPDRHRVAELWRQAHSPRCGGPIGPPEHIATSRKRLLHAVERRRNCLTCGETACHARPDIVPLRLLDPSRGPSR